MTTYTAAQAVEMLTSAGHDEADVLAVIDGLIDAGIEGPYDEATEEQMFTEGDMSVLARRWWRGVLLDEITIAALGLGSHRPRHDAVSLLEVAAGRYRACVADSQQAREDLADAVRQAVAGGMSEVRAARIAGVGRMTVRKWVGK